jgi:hypothetical protein
MCAEEEWYTQYRHDDHLILLCAWNGWNPSSSAFREIFNRWLVLAVPINVIKDT